MAETTGPNAAAPPPPPASEKRRAPRSPVRQTDLDNLKRAGKIAAAAQAAEAL